MTNIYYPPEFLMDNTSSMFWYMKFNQDAISFPSNVDELIPSGMNT